jgi:hypothetical protein
MEISNILNWITASIPHIRWLLIRFQFLQTKPTEGRHVYLC